MDFDLIASIHLSTAVLITLFILLMSLEPAYLKRLVIASAFLFIIPHILAMAAGWIGGELDVPALEIILLRQGAFSSLAAISYGLLLGSMLNYLKICTINKFRKMRQQD